MQNQPSEGNGAASDRRPGVSAVIPAYNAEKTIERALNSVLAQTYANIVDVIVVDDGSGDDTAAVVRERFPEVTLIQQENAGNGAARNTGVREAQGELLAFLDADDEWLPEKIAVQAEEMTQFPGCAMSISGQLTLLAGEGVESHAPAERDECLNFLTFRDIVAEGALPPDIFACCSGWVYRTEIFRELGGFSSELRRCVDEEMLMRTTSRGYTVLAISRRLYVRYLRPESVSRGPEAVQKGPATKACVIERYAPDADNPRGRILSPEEYDLYLKRVFIAGAERQLADGYVTEAREMLRNTSAHPTRSRSLARRIRALRALSYLGGPVCRTLGSIYRAVRGSKS